MTRKTKTKSNASGSFAVARRDLLLALAALALAASAGEQGELDQARSLLRRLLDADAARGLLRGQGLCYYIESILGDPTEGAKVEFCEDGTVNIYVGTQSNGQGHETVYAQFLADQTGIPADLITVIQGDSDRIAQGGGTGGSRSVTTQTTATLATIDVMMAAFLPYLADKMGVEAADVEFDDERFRAPGSNLTPTFLEAADMARQDGRVDLLSHEARAQLPGRRGRGREHICLHDAPMRAGPGECGQIEPFIRRDPSRER